MGFKHPVKQTIVAVLLTSAVSYAPAALAEYPGEVWSVEAISIKIVDQAEKGLAKSTVRRALQGANDVYFYGEDAARLHAEISGGDAPTLRLSLHGRNSGGVIARSAPMPVSGNADSIRTVALAWMETLTCARAGCASAPEASQPVRVAKARLDVAPTRSTADQIDAPAIQSRVAGIPLPKPRPGSTPVSGRSSKAKLDGSGLAGKDLGFAAVPIQIALSVPREVGALTYTDADQLILDDSVQVARVSPNAPVAAVPVRPAPAVRTVPKAPQADTSIVGRWLSKVADFLGIKRPETATGSATPVQTPALQASASAVQQPKPAESTTVATIPESSLAAAVPVPQPSQAPAQSLWRRATEPVTLINPIDRFRPAGTVPALSDGERIAVAETQAPITDPANASRAAEVLLTRDLLRPVQRPLVDSGTTTVVAAPRVTRTNLSVRLAPELLRQYNQGGLASAATARQRSTGNASRKISGPLLDDSSKLNAILRERGMAVDIAGYNRFERIYSSGTEQEGFWISLPNAVNAKFVLVSGPDASVIASVRRRPGIARASSGVAEALELKPREWARLRVIGLKVMNRSAALFPPLDWFSVRKGRNLIQ